MSGRAFKRIDRRDGIVEIHVRKYLAFGLELQRVFVLDDVVVRYFRGLYLPEIISLATKFHELFARPFIIKTRGPV